MKHLYRSTSAEGATESDDSKQKGRRYWCRLLPHTQPSCVALCLPLELSFSR